MAESAAAARRPSRLREGRRSRRHKLLVVARAVLGGLDTLVDLLAVLAAGALVDLVAGAVQTVVDLLLVLVDEVLGLVQDIAHRGTPSSSPTAFPRSAAANWVVGARSARAALPLFGRCLPSLRARYALAARPLRSV